MDSKDFVGVQKEILSTHAQNQLVSAGAGSGKTTVMVQKIADLIIEQGVDVKSLLVVTFTVLAAQEMKTRLIDKLNEKLVSSSDKQHILDIIDKVKQASIDTIDGFASKTIKKYFYVLNISPNIEIITDATRDYYLSRAMKQTMDKLSEDSYSINLMLDIFGGNERNLNQLEQLVMTAYNNVINIEDYTKFLNDSKNQYTPNSMCEKVVNEYLVNHILAAKQLIVENYLDADESVKTLLTNFVEEIDKFNLNNNLKTNLTMLFDLNTSIFDRKLKGELKDAIGLIKDVVSYFEKNMIDADFEENYTKITEYFNKFVQILQNFIENYNALKQKNNLVDFNDLNRLMLKLLENEVVKQELNNQYKYIFVDEYQDVNPLQDSLITKLKGKDSLLFTVGDVKQSIYGFRGASPEWFINKYNEYKLDTSKGYAYNMNDNYRTNPLILNFVNEVFCSIMTEKSANIDYKTDGSINPKRGDIVDEKVKILLTPEIEPAIPTGVYSVKKASGQKSQFDSEAVMVAEHIRNILKKPFYDANIKAYRPLRFSDIAILSRSIEDKKMQELIRVLRLGNIPVKTTTKLEIDSEGIKLILSILKCVNNTADDVDLLAFYLSLSPLTIDELVEIHNKNSTFKQTITNTQNPSIIAGKTCLNNIKTAALSNTNRGLIRYILNEGKLRYYLLTKPNGENTISVIEEFINKISPLEDSLNLTEFIRVVESNLTRFSEVETMDNEDSITIQTIHKSKGLEYPVVVLFNTSKQFRYVTENEIVNFNADLGLGVDYFDIINRTKSSSIPHMAIKILNNSKGYKEEMRLLYVAMTRAKNKLYITGSYNPKSLDKPFSTNNFLGMILNNYNLKLNVGQNSFDNCEITLNEEPSYFKQSNLEEQKIITNNYKDFVYPNSQKFNLPIKNTVTGLNSQQSQSQKFTTKRWITTDMQYSEEDRALVGTHYHKALELIDYFKPYSKSSEFDDIDYNKIRLAHQKISALVVGAKATHKEAEFMMYVPYNEVINLSEREAGNLQNLSQNTQNLQKNEQKTQNLVKNLQKNENLSEITDKILIQGVVDLIIEFEDKITIVDYKFSNLKIDVLKQKYIEQLCLYKLAVEKAFKKPVEHVYIYSINTGELL